MKLALSIKLLTTLAVLTTVSSQAFAADGDNRDRKQAKRAEAQMQRAQQQGFNDASRDQRQAQRAQQMMVEQNRQKANELARQQERAREQAHRDQANQMTRQQDRARERAERDQERAQRDRERALQNAQKDARREAKIDNRMPNVTQVPPRWNEDRDRDDRRWDSKNRRDNENRWDKNHRWYTDRKIVSYNKAFRNWDAERNYLKANIRRLNQANKLSQLQQQQLNAQMQAAYLAYHNNQYNGAYNWDYYSEPQFLDYLQLNQPSLLDRILGYLGIGNGGYGYANNYLYSNNWNSERDQLARNMSQIHQLALQGRITPYQEQQLLAQMRTEYLSYRNNNYNGGYGWNQYSDPGFVDYLNNSRPSILTTIRNYLGM